MTAARAGRRAARPVAVGAVSATLLAGVAGTAGPGAAEEHLHLVSARADGTTRPGPSGTFGLSVSATGAAVAFASAAPGLVDADPDALADVFVKRVDTGRLQLASTSATGRKASSSSTRPSIDGAGQQVVFLSAADDLHPHDDDDLADVFVKHLESGAVVLASTSSTGVKADAPSAAPVLSPDGRRVAFTSRATNLTPDDTDQRTDVFVKDLVTGELRLANRRADGTGAPAGDYGTGRPSLSADGTRVAFDTDAALAPEDTDAAPDVYVKDLVTGRLVLASISGAGDGSARGSYRPSLSADGERVAFDSFSADLHPADGSEDDDVFVKDLRTGALQLASADATGRGATGRSTEASLSADGRRVAFSSDAVDLGPAGLDGTLQTFVKDLTTGAVTLASAGASGRPAERLSIAPALSADGSAVVFATPAALVPQDDNGWADVYLRRLRPTGPPPDRTAPQVRLTASPDRLVGGSGRVRVALTGDADDTGSGIASVRFRVTDEYGRVALSVVPVAGEGRRSVAWTRMLPVPGRVRRGDSDGRTFTVAATATDRSGNVTRTQMHIVVAPRDDRR